MIYWKNLYKCGNFCKFFSFFKLDILRKQLFKFTLLRPQTPFFPFPLELSPTGIFYIHTAYIYLPSIYKQKSVLKKLWTIFYRTAPYHVFYVLGPITPAWIVLTHSGSSSSSLFCITTIFGVCKFQKSIWQKLYRSAASSVMHNGQTSEPFQVSDRIAYFRHFFQCCPWLGIKRCQQNNSSIRWTMTSHLTDLDDVCLIAHI